MLTLRASRERITSHGGDALQLRHSLENHLPLKGDSYRQQHAEATQQVEAHSQQGADGKLLERQRHGFHLACSFCAIRESADSKRATVFPLTPFNRHPIFVHKEQ